jgi:hypothetical protein
MNQVLDQEWQRIAANAICHAAEKSLENIRIAVAAYEVPSAVYRPKLSIDGNQWCALYGENLQDGVAGFGNSPADAMWDFDRNWHAPTAAPMKVPDALAP